MKATILGKGGTSRELAHWLSSQDYKHIQYLDDQCTDKDVVGQISDWNSINDSDLFLGMGTYKSMHQRKLWIEKLPRHRFPSVHADTSNIYSKNWGQGCQIFPLATVSLNTAIKDFALIYHNCVISHDSIIESNVIISNSAVLSGSTHIDENTYIGANATILEGIKIGKNCVIAAGSTVTRDVPDNHIYYAPRKMKENHYASAT